MFKKLIIKKEYVNYGINFPEPMDKKQWVGESHEVVYYDDKYDNLFIGNKGVVGGKIRPFSIIELENMNQEFLKYFDVVDYELTDEDLDFAKAKIKEENDPWGNLLISLLEIGEVLAELAEESLEVEEVEEQKYYIILPHISELDAYLNYDIELEKYEFADKTQVEGYQTQFTQKEIDAFIPEYDAFKVEVSK